MSEPSSFEPTSGVPPIGLPPEWVWREQRIGELLAAIDRYLTDIRSGANATQAHYKALVKWSEELVEHFAWMKGREQRQREKEQAEHAASVERRRKQQALAERTASV